MLLLSTIILLFIATGLGYYFGGKQGATGTFLTILFLFALPAIIYMMQSS